MKVTIIGAGCGPQTWSGEARAALCAADLIIGPSRVLDWAQVILTQDIPPMIPEYRPCEIAQHLRESSAKKPCILYSGDVGFYSGAAGLVSYLEEYGAAEQITDPKACGPADMHICVLPGISSVQLLSARLKRPWQDWRLCSAHGTDCDPVYEVIQGTPVFFLTSGKEGPAELCRQLTEAGLGWLKVTVGENLGACVRKTEGMEPAENTKTAIGHHEERITTMPAQVCAELEFAPLNVLLAEAAPRLPARTPGIPDESFLREKVPMTKQEVRAAALAKLAPGPQDVCWDIGAGTGSVSVELALQARSVWAVERKAEALSLIRRNREKFCAWNLHVVEGAAPEALKDLPRPNVVFVGGSGGNLREILAVIREANPLARVLVSAIALETLQTAVEAMQQLGWEVSVTQIAVSRTHKAGGLHLLTALNPVFLISATEQDLAAE